MAAGAWARALGLARGRAEAVAGALAPWRLRAAERAGEARERFARLAESTAGTARAVQERWAAGGVSALADGAREGWARARQRLEASWIWDWRPRPWTKYKEVLTEQPMVCNCLTAGAFYGAGDWLAQHLEKRMGIESHGKEHHNTARTLRMVVFGFFIAGPTYCKWYPQLQKLTSAYRSQYEPIRVGFLRLPIFRREDLKEPSERAAEVAVKVMVENLFFQPPFLTLYFFVMGALEGLPFHAVYEKTRQNFHDSWFLALMVWVPVQAVNFWFMPVYLQAPVTQTVNMGWKVGLSLFYHSRQYGGAAHLDAIGSSGPLHADATAGGELGPADGAGARAAAGLEADVAQLWGRMEAVLARQAAEAEAVAGLRRQAEGQLEAMRRQADALAALARQAEDRQRRLEEPLAALERQLEAQGRALHRQAEELGRLRAALAPGPPPRQEGEEDREEVLGAEAQLTRQGEVAVPRGGILGPLAQ